MKSYGLQAPTRKAGVIDADFPYFMQIQWKLLEVEFGCINGRLYTKPGTRIEDSKRAYRLTSDTWHHIEERIWGERIIQSAVDQNQRWKQTFPDRWYKVFVFRPIPDTVQTLLPGDIDLESPTF